MAGKDNLRTPSTEEARAMQLLSAKKRSENVKAKKIFKEELEKRLGVKDFEEIIDNLILRAKKDDKSFEVLRDTMGQKPSDKIEANFTYEDTLKKVVDENDY
jgi:hypothetical protein